MIFKKIINSFQSSISLQIEERKEEKIKSFQNTQKKQIVFLYFETECI